jgi:transposase
MGHWSCGEGRDVEESAGELAIFSATICRWCKQSKVDSGEIADVNSAIAAELADARRRIRELEEELAATQFAASMLKDQSIRLT